MPAVRNVRARMAPPPEAPAPIAPAQPDVPPPDAVLNRAPQNMPARVLQGMYGQHMPAMADCLCVEVSDEALAQCVQFGSDDIAEVLDQLPGRYFKLGYFNGAACFRQEPSFDALNNHGLFIWKSDTVDGWFISPSVGVSDGGEDGNSWPVAWCSDGISGIPQDVHVPPNNRELCPGLCVSTFVEFAEKAAAAKGKGKGGKGKKTHGGWMGRTFGLLKAIVSRDLDEYHKLVREYLLRDDMVALWQKLEGSSHCIYVA